MIAMAAMDTIAPLTDLAFSGHCFTQRMQEMHFLASAVKFAGSMACTGQLAAHRPRNHCALTLALDAPGE